MLKEENDFWSLAHQSQTLKKILNRSEELGIPNWHFGAGFLAQTIWNLRSGHLENQFINDVDWVYFDSDDLSNESETKIEQLSEFTKRMTSSH